MAFKESLKKEVRMKSDGRCVLCHKPFVDIHHIIPQKENGNDTIDNAVALCAYCHDLIGDNPTKRKQLKEIRNSWYEIVKASKTPKSIIYEKIKFLPPVKQKDDKMIAVYHVVFEDENFNDAAIAIMELTRKTVKEHKNQKRVLYLDIDGHRLSDGAFDADMWELQFNFITQNLLYYYSEINLPIVKIINPYEQLEEDLPDKFVIYDSGEFPEELEGCLFKTVAS